MDGVFDVAGDDGSQEDELSDDIGAGLVKKKPALKPEVASLSSDIFSSMDTASQLLGPYGKVVMAIQGLTAANQASVVQGFFKRVRQIDWTIYRLALLMDMPYR